MNIIMNDDSLVSVAQLNEFHKTLKGAKFKSKDKREAYEWVGKTLGKFHYFSETKKNKGLIKKYIIQMTGYSAGNIDKLIARKKKFGRVFVCERTQHKFPIFYTVSDISLLADLCNRYQGQNAKAIKHVLKDQSEKFGDTRFERLSHISVSHIYNLKKTRVFRSKSLVYTKTNPTKVSIGERRKPQPFGKPGFLRVDSVHQGDLDKQKGVYHINLVDEVTQGEVLVCVEKISEYFLIPALLSAFEQFPFKIINFHSDNGSEYINKTVAKLLNKLKITQTKSRSRKSNDNALAEGKNAAVPRKYIGHAHIPQKHAEKINIFYKEHLNPFVNLHRFCAFPVEEVDGKGKVVKKYPLDEYMTPVGKLLSIENMEQYLKEGVSVESLEDKLKETSHYDVSGSVQKARKKLFESINSRS